MKEMERDAIQAILDDPKRQWTKDEIKAHVGCPDNPLAWSRLQRAITSHPDILTRHSWGLWDYMRKPVKRARAPRKRAS
jgi:hypothetical protein